MTTCTPEAHAVAVHPSTTLSFSRRTQSWLSILLSPVRAPLLALDGLLCWLGVVAGSWLSPYIKFGTFDRENVVFGLIFAVSFALAALGLGYYERENRFAWKQFLSLAAFAWIIGTGLSFTFFHLAYFIQIGRIQLLFSFIVAFVLVLLARSILALVLRNYSYKYVVFGSRSAISEEIRNCRSYARIGQHYLHVDVMEEWLSQPQNTSPEELLSLLNRYEVSEIVLTKDAPLNERLVAFSMHALRAGYRVVDEVSFYSLVFGRYPVQALSENWILFSGIDTHRPGTRLLKRSIDIVLSGFGILITGPILLTIAILIKLTSRGPILFVQERQGRYCIPFKIYKFRTMKANPIGFNPPSTRPNDPRITAIGKWIRPLHLDELPQLFNILKGDMSFVGPRPEDLRFAEQIRKTVPIYDYRHLIRPGLTGASQLELGYTLDNVQDTYKKLAYDLYYLSKYDILGDFVLILRTVFYLIRKTA